jgi:hypothetical protein
MPKTHINYPPVFTMIFRRMNQRATAGRPYRLTTGFWVVLVRCGLRPPARGKCPKRVLIARLGLLTIFPRKDRRATAGRPYRLTTGFWVVLRCLARPEQMPKTRINYPPVFTMIFRRKEPAGDRRSPLQADNGVLGGTCRGGLRPPARGKCPKRVLITRLYLL